MTRKHVVRGQTGWGVTYSSTRICAQKGSTVEIRCIYTYPSRSDDLHTAVEETFWFTKLQDKGPVDLRTDPQYSGRVQYRCSKNSCTLSITDLRESDSAVYKFRFIINQPGESYTGSPGVTLSVTGLTVHINNFTPCKLETCKWAELECHSSCSLPGRSSYIWDKNEKIMTETTRYFSDYFYPADSVSCAVKGREGFPSPLLCVYGSSCNRVTYTVRTICAFRGSSVDISCTYNSYGSVTSKFWFSPEHSRHWKSPSQPEDLRKNSQYAGRVQVLETETGRSTLRITDLRESDSAQYRFTFKTKGFEWRNSLPGTTLTVTDPDLQVQVIWSPTGPKLVCLSSCLLPGPSSFVWYKNEEAVVAETSPSYGAYIDPADSYSCAIKGHETYRSLPVYAPKLPSVLESRPGDIMKDSSLSLTCSSDANPPPQYTWYKKNQTLAKREPQLLFSSIQSSDSGEYYCTAENKLGRTASKYVLINVKYGPQTSNVSVSPSAEVEEGSSVTLTCSSDANPAANYTWYKGNRTLLQGPEGIYHFNSISSEDRGMYYCKSENQHGQITSDPRFLDVQYPPKPPSVSVSPSAEVEEGSSVTLTCSSDANPAANYTWYKENEESPKASGQNFTITDFRPEHSGNYYCEVQNRRGRHSSTVHLTVAAGAVKAAAGAITAVLLAVILLAVFLWVRRKKSFSQQCRHGERADNKAQPDMAPVYDTPSATAQRQPAEQQDYLHYASVCFSQTQEDALYSNIRPALSHTQTEEEEEKDGVEYTTVRCVSACSGPGTRHQDGGEDSFALYSTVNKT